MRTIKGTGYVHYQRVYKCSVQHHLQMFNHISVDMVMGNLRLTSLTISLNIFYHVLLQPCR